MNFYPIFTFLFPILFLSACNNNSSTTQDAAAPAQTVANNNTATNNVTTATDSSKTKNAIADSATLGAKPQEALQPDHERQHRTIDLMSVTKFSKKGLIIGQDVNEYLIKGEPKQKISIKLESLSKDISFSVIRPDEQNLVSNKTEWEGELRGKGKYSIRVDLDEEAAKAGKVVSYKLLFDIDRKEMQLPSREDVLQGKTHPQIEKPKDKGKK